MHTSAVLISGLAAVASATTSTWGYTTSTSSSSTSSYDPTWTGGWTSSSTTSKAAVSTSYDPSWSAWTSTSTSTSYDPTSYDPTWSVWTSTSTSYDPTWSASYDPTWSAWTSTSTSYDPAWTAWGTTPVAATTPCPVWTGGAAPPAYYTNLPDSIKSALPSWTGAPPSDYCYYTSWMQSFSSCTAPAVVHPTTFASTAAKATGTASAYGTWSGTTGVAPVATFKGAANANAASYAVAGLAAAAALVMA